MKLRLTTTNDLTAVMTIINQAKVYFKEQGINQWQDGYPDELTILMILAAMKLMCLKITEK